MADIKMKVRADRVAEVIQAPTLKENTVDAMIKASQMSDDAQAIKNEEERQKRIREQSQENLLMH